MAVLDDDALAGTVGRVLVGPGALAALHDYGIVVDVHEAAVYEYVGAGIDVNGVGRWCPSRGVWSEDVLRRCIDVAAQIAHMMALVDVVGPEG